MKREHVQRRRPGRIGRLVAVGVFGTVLALAGTVATPAPAEAATRSGLLRNAETGRCLDSDHAGSVYIRACQRGNDFQTWDISSDGIDPAYKKSLDGQHFRFQFRNRATGKCLSMWKGAGDARPGLAAGNCWEQPESSYLDGRGPGFNSLHIRAWYRLSHFHQVCVNGYTHAANAAICDYNSDRQRWSLIPA
ncbi:RICIN domain-containing protein [Streptomyces sp. NPDC090022]|uniref:RICIN domain-containing protein n=1 Tax=Streptomyces sp. NPDC090022 TaxID=3365920 RepID=UPI00382AAF71